MLECPFNPAKALPFTVSSLVFVSPASMVDTYMDHDARVVTLLVSNQ